MCSHIDNCLIVQKKLNPGHIAIPYTKLIKNHILYILTMMR